MRINPTEIESVIAHFEAKEVALVADLAEVRVTLSQLRRERGSGSVAVVADAEVAGPSHPSQGKAAESPIFAIVPGSEPTNLAGYIDRVLSAANGKWMDTRQIREAVLALPGGPSSAAEDSIRSLMSKNRIAYGWTRGGSTKRALWAKSAKGQSKEAANATATG